MFAVKKKNLALPSVVNGRKKRKTGKQENKKKREKGKREKKGEKKGGRKIYVHADIGKVNRAVERLMALFIGDLFLFFN